MGGFDLGFERAGMKSVAHVEIEKNCHAVLAEHFPHAQLHQDVTKITKQTFGNGTIELICGGFPCQDLSVAGRRAGLAGERSGLWHNFRNIVEWYRPQWVVIENVPGLLSSNRGGDLATVLSGLEELGYEWAYRVLDAQYFGLAQRRKRLFIVGYLGRGRAAKVLFEPESLSWDLEPRREKRKGVARTLTAGTSKNSNPPGRRGEDDYNIVVDQPDAVDVRNLRMQGGVSGTLQSKPNGGYSLNYTNPVIQQQPNEIAPAVTSKWAKGSGGPSGDECQNMVLAVRTAQTGANGIGVQEDAAYTLDGAEGQAVLAPFNLQQITSKENRASVEDGAPTPTVPNRGGASAITQIGVRRLTPEECLVLQGFPATWLDGFGLSDSAKYKMIGNAVAEPVVNWIGRRIMKVSKETSL